MQGMRRTPKEGLVKSWNINVSSRWIHCSILCMVKCHLFHTCCHVGSTTIWNISVRPSRNPRETVEGLSKGLHVHVKPDETRKPGFLSDYVQNQVLRFPPKKKLTEGAVGIYIYTKHPRSPKTILGTTQVKEIDFRII